MFHSLFAILILIRCGKLAYKWGFHRNFAYLFKLIARFYWWICTPHISIFRWSSVEFFLDRDECVETWIVKITRINIFYVTNVISCITQLNTAKIEYEKKDSSRKSHFFAPKIQKRLRKGKNSLATWLLVWKSKSVNSSTHAKGERNTLQSANGATYYVFTHQNAIQVPITWSGLVDCRNNDVEIPLCVIWLLFLNKSVLNLVRVFFLMFVSIRLPFVLLSCCFIFLQACAGQRFWWSLELSCLTFV